MTRGVQSWAQVQKDDNQKDENMDGYLKAKRLVNVCSILLPHGQVAKSLQTVEWPRYLACRTLTIRGVPHISTATTGRKTSVIGESNGGIAPSCGEGHNK